MPIVFADVETTGLSADQNKVLEVAAIATDERLNEIARFQRVVYFPYAAEILELHAGGLDAKAISRAFVTGCADSKVVQMHLDNGLWAESRSGIALDTVDRDFSEFIDKHCVTMKPGIDGAPDERVLPQLAGSSIHFDRTFVERHLQRAARLLHYRMIDISTFTETARRFWPELYECRPKNETKAHRAMRDIEESIAYYKFYLDHLAALRAGDKILRLVATTVPAQVSDEQKAANTAALVSPTGALIAPDPGVPSDVGHGSCARWPERGAR
jgi:oligoribonuclease